MENSKIEWTDHTFNPWIGCHKVSPGCKFCYAESMDTRWKGNRWGKDALRSVTSDAYWKKPLLWNKHAKKNGKADKVFCGSLCDWAEGREDTLPYLKRLFKLIEATPWLMWQMLTKRPENVLKLVPDSWKKNFPPNVWIGTSVENQEMADKRIPELMKIPASIRFLSCEPLLGYVDISSYKYRYGSIGPICMACSGNGRYSDNFNTPCPDCDETGRTPWGIHWIIIGGESGHHARPPHPDWIKSIIVQSTTAGIPVFFKQWGEWAEGSNVKDGKYVGKHVCLFDNGDCFNYLDPKEYKKYTLRYGDRWSKMNPSVMSWLGKKISGRSIGGHEYSNFPQ